MLLVPQVRDPEGDRERVVRASAQGVRPQDPPARGSQDGEEREEVPQAGAGGDQDPRAPEEAGQGQHLQYHPHVRQLLIQVIQQIIHSWPQAKNCISDISVKLAIKLFTLMSNPLIYHKQC